MTEFTAGINVRVSTVALWREVLALRDAGLPARDCLPLALQALIHAGRADVTVRIAKQTQPEPPA